MSGRLPYPPALALIAIGAMSLPAAARADDAVVGDGTPASCTDAAFDAAILQVYFGGSQGGRVSFNCGMTPVTIALASSKLLDAGVATEIDGGGRISLDAGNQHRHFEVRDVGTTLTLRGLTLRSGQASDFGGAAFVRAGAGLFVHDSRFFNNGAVTSGGAIAGEDGSSLSVLDSRFDLNSAGAGGAIAKTGQLTIANSSFNENSATDQGGALQWWFPIGGDVVTSTFTGNTASSGGAILIRGGTARLDGVRLDGNIVTGDGGGLHAYDDAQIEVLRTTIVNNRANSRGGGVRLEGFQRPPAEIDPGNIIPPTPGTAAVISDSMIASNVAGSGGGIYVFGPFIEGRYATLELRDSQVRANTAGAGGGIVNQGQMTLRRVRVLDNIANAASGFGDGGGLYMDAVNAQASTLLEQTLIRGNSALDTGGGMEAFGHPLTLRGVTFVENIARDGGGARIYALRAMNLAQAAFVRNLATRDGGGLVLKQEAPVQLSSMTFAENKANSGFGHDLYMAAEFPSAGPKLEVSLLHVTAINTTGAPGISVIAASEKGFRFRNSIVFSNAQDCGGPNLSEGGNLLGELNCGSHPTDLQPATLNVLGLGSVIESGYDSYYLPAANSPAVDFPTCAPGTSSDQRGLPMNRDGDGDGFLGCDAGAIERQSASEQPPAGSLFRNGFESP